MAINAKKSLIVGTSSTMRRPGNGEELTSVWDQLLTSISKTGSKAEFAQLFDHFAPLIKAYGFSSGLTYFGEQLAEDLVQEVMLKVWNNRHRYDPKQASANTWIFTIARNHRIDMLRKLGREKVDPDIETDELVHENAEEPVTSIQHIVITRRVRESMAYLPQEQKEVLNKVFMEGKSHQLVAEELKLPLGTVKSRVRLAMKKMRLSLEKLEL